MGKRAVLLWSLPLLGLGCAVLSPPSGEPAPQPAAVDTVEPADPLKLAAECLERGDDAAARPHLARYIAAHPDHVAIRVHLAEVLMRTGRRTEAQREFERYVADAQGAGADQHLIHVHTRLVEIAAADGDAYRERLHRGIGLFLLAKQVQAKQEDGGPEPEKLLFKAAAELKEAAKANPDDARAYWYSYEVWVHLGQSLPARTSLRRARDCAPLSDLTSAEREGLSAACEGEFATLR